MRKFFYLKTRGQRYLVWGTFLIIITATFIIALIEAKSDYGSLDYPPIFSNSDQWDYLVISYSFMKTNIFGRYYTEEYIQPFLKFNEQHRDELNDNQKSMIDRVIYHKIDEKPIPNTYRPWMYPVLVGIVFKIFGYSFTVARMVNVFLFTASTGLIFWLAYKKQGYLAALMAVIFFLVIPQTLMQTRYLATEVMGGFVVILSLFTLYIALKDKPRIHKYFFWGLSLGFLILTRTAFGFSLISVCLTTLIYFAWRILKKEQGVFSCGVAILVGILFMVLPLISWNIGITGTTKLLSGTNAWVVVHAGYTQEYLNGKSPFKIRDQLYKEYETKNNIDIKNDTEKALAGIEIYNEIMQDPKTRDRIPSLVLFKLKNALTAQKSEWALRVLFVIGVLIYRRDFFTWVCVSIVVGHLIGIGLFVHANGRLFLTSSPAVVLMAALATPTICRKILTSKNYLTLFGKTRSILLKNRQ